MKATGNSLKSPVKASLQNTKQTAVELDEAKASVQQWGKYHKKFKYFVVRIWLSV